LVLGDIHCASLGNLQEKFKAFPQTTACPRAIIRSLEKRRLDQRTQPRPRERPLADVAADQHRRWAELEPQQRSKERII
jgi:hypothetical protein